MTSAALRLTISTGLFIHFVDLYYNLMYLLFSASVSQRNGDPGYTQVEPAS